MVGLLAYFAGGVIGGFVVTRLFAWLLKRVASAPIGAAYLFAWVGACLLATWGMAGDGGGVVQLLIAYAAYGVGALLNYALDRRAQRTAQDVADFE